MMKYAPDTQMKRDGAMVTLPFAEKTMGIASFDPERAVLYFFQGNPNISFVEALP